MLNVGLLVNLFTGHLLADFLFQADSWVEDKQNRRLWGYGIWLHAVVVLAMTMVAIGDFRCKYIG